MGQQRKVLTPERSARHWWGAELRAHRDRLGLSLARLALRVRYDAGYLGRLERGDQFPALRVAETCDRELGAGGELVRIWHVADDERRRNAGDAASSGVYEASTDVLAVGSAVLSAGLGAVDGASYPADLVSSVALLDGLTGADMSDSSAVAQAGWIPAVVPGVISGYLFAGPSWSGERDEGVLALPRAGAGAGAGQRIRDFTHTLMDLDFRYGGGHVRRVLLFWFRSEIVPLLRMHHPDAVRRDVFGAASEVLQLLGWSAYDAGRHGGAQRYFVQGLRLAGEAQDTVLGGRLLGNLSHQANYLGHYGEALQLARAAQSAAAGRASAAVQASFLAMEARALASSGDARGYARILHRAEQELARRVDGADPEWIGYFDDLELAGEAAHCARDLCQPRETQEFAIRALDPVSTPPRTRAFLALVAAAGAFRAGNIDEALALASGAVELAGSLQSARYLRYVTDFHTSVTERHAANPAVRRFTELLTTAHPTLQLASGANGA